ncbi:hypothetical protein E2C01_067198 [Portunus trituberculatus]|uniref:Uncharacterized protein n=1 Tax=Portunus trituberculatus TaxID=210409 RepID=A0A5B7HT03_PORTR|nr:hypothetical protein [Portunus trituberculatus]
MIFPLLKEQNYEDCPFPSPTEFQSFRPIKYHYFIYLPPPPPPTSAHEKVNLPPEVTHARSSSTNSHNIVAVIKFRKTEIAKTRVQEMRLRVSGRTMGGWTGGWRESISHQLVGNNTLTAQTTTNTTTTHHYPPPPPSNTFSVTTLLHTSKPRKTHPAPHPYTRPSSATISDLAGQLGTRRTACHPRSFPYVTTQRRSCSPIPLRSYV